MQDKYKMLQDSLGSERLKFKEELKYHSAMPTKGVAEVFYIATTQAELIEVLDLATQLKISYIIIGGGTKTFVPNEGIKGLVIKNRTSNIKIGGIKGKVGRVGIGVEEAMVEADSGVTIAKLNEFLNAQNLAVVVTNQTNQSSLGSTVLTDKVLQELTQKITVWVDQEVIELPVEQLLRNYIVLSLILKVKAKV